MKHVMTAMVMTATAAQTPVSKRVVVMAFAGMMSPLVHENSKPDDGNDNNNDNCLNTCAFAACGDGVVN